MKSVFEHIREHLHVCAGLAAPTDVSTYDKYSWSIYFERLMRNRLVIGAMRYGVQGGPKLKNYDRIKGMEKRLSQFKETGNMDCLIDVANLAMLESYESQHPNFHFAALDGDHSCV